MSNLKDLNARIKAHPILTSDQAVMCRAFARQRAKDGGEPFTLLEFAQIALRATARDYVEALSDDRPRSVASIVADREHNQAAMLYAYEQLRACEEPIVAECPDRELALELISDTAGNLK